MIRFYSFSSEGLWSLEIETYYEPKFNDTMARESPTFATIMVSSFIKIAIAQVPDLSLRDFSFLIVNLDSALAKPFLIAVSKLSGNASSVEMY